MRPLSKRVEYGIITATCPDQWGTDPLAVSHGLHANKATNSLHCKTTLSQWPPTLVLVELGAQAFVPAQNSNVKFN